MSFEGGEVKQQQANKHAQQAQYILGQLFQSLDGCTSEVSELIDKKRKEGSWSNNTCRSYLNSLRLYTIYIWHLTALGQLNEFNYDLNKLSSFLCSIKTWSQSLVKKVRRDNKDSIKMNKSSIVNPEDIANYLTGSRANAALDLLATPQPCSMKIHSTVRNYLLLQISLSNANRSGCLINIMKKDLIDAACKSDSFILLVKEHKTANTYGCAELVVEQKLYSHLLTYVSKYRPQSSHNNLFLSWTGQPMDSGIICHALSTELSHVGIEKR